MPSGVYKHTKTHNRKVGLSRKNKTYEEIYGIERAKELREKKRGKKHNVSEEGRNRMSIACTGENNPVWMGDKAKKHSIHVWINRHFGHAFKCENPNCLGKGKRFEWANKKKHTYYSRNIKDYYQLCTICHKAYDMGILQL